MQLLRTHAQFLLLIASLLTSVTASSWGFADATVSVQSKGSGVGGGVKEKSISLCLPSTGLTKFPGYPKAKHFQQLLPLARQTP